MVLAHQRNGIVSLHLCPLSRDAGGVKTTDRNLRQAHLGKREGFGRVTRPRRQSQGLCATLAQPLLPLHSLHVLTLRSERHHFFPSTSLRIRLSSDSSATKCLSRRFSSSS